MEDTHEVEQVRLSGRHTDCTSIYFSSMKRRCPPGAVDVSILDSTTQVHVSNVTETATAVGQVLLEPSELVSKSC